MCLENWELSITVINFYNTHTETSHSEHLGLNE